MIYKDIQSRYDTEETPAYRPQACINCGEHWGAHSGWTCSVYASGQIDQNYFSCTSMSPSKRFLTQEMADSITNDLLTMVKTFKHGFGSSPLPSNNETKVDVNDWRAWANNKPGECACGIARQDCTYHK